METNQMEENISDLELLSNQLAENFSQTINILSNIVLLTERYYEGSHSRFVSVKSYEVAEALGLSETECYQIKIAGLLHDIGKVGFRESLLSKFTNEMKVYEHREYIQHCIIGMKLLQNYIGMSHISELIYQHHERIDGSGYPRKLYGSEIMAGARIIAVVDTYHNLVYRSHKDKMSGDSSAIHASNTTTYLEASQKRYASTMNYLNIKKGVLFDSKAVEIFMDIIQNERKGYGKQTVMRIPVNKLEEGMTFAEDYFTKYGLLIAAKGEKASKDSSKVLIKFVEADEMPPKVLVIK